MIHCDHRDERGMKLQVIMLGSVEVCARCIEGVRAMRTARLSDSVRQMNYAAVEMQAMAGMMKEVGMDVLGDEVTGTEEQYEEFKRRWRSKHPESKFAELYGMGDASED